MRLFLVGDPFHFDHRIHIVVRAQDIAAAQLALGALVDEDPLLLFNLDIDWFHQTTARFETIAWINIDVLRMQALRAMVSIARTHNFIPAVAAGEILNFFAEFFRHTIIIRLAQLSSSRKIRKSELLRAVRIYPGSPS